MWRYLWQILSEYDIVHINSFIDELMMRFGNSWSRGSNIIRKEVKVVK